MHLYKISHITVDLGAAEKYCKAIWINSDELKDVIMHLGNFHDFMHFFINWGKFISDSGFGEVLYQARMCLVGNSRSWIIHEAVAEAMYILHL